MQKRHDSDTQRRMQFPTGASQLRRQVTRMGSRPRTMRVSISKKTFAY